MSRPARVVIYEVGPRDGLQNVAQHVPSDAKIAFIDALSEAGLSAIEAASFVSPRAIPQLADGAAIMAGIRKRDGVRYPVLVPNLRGFEAALAAGAREVCVFTAASESFTRANVHASIDESIERFRPVCERAAAEGVVVRGYVSTAFGCPFEGDVPVSQVIRVAGLLDRLGCAEISIGDTIGIARPHQIREVIGALAGLLPMGRIALHLHDTWGRALANIMTALEAGVTTFDSSAGGLGGCPHAPGATGNVATEDVVSLLEGEGVETGVDLGKLASASVALSAATGIPLASRALAALRAQSARRA